MNFRKTLLAVSFILACGVHSAAQASPDSDFQAQAQADFQTIASFMNGPFANAMGFFTGLGWDIPPTVYDLALGPHFELSVGAGADFIPLPNLGSLNLPAVSASTNLSLPSGIPLPYPIVTARIGLFNGFDAGFRYTYLPPVSAVGVGGNFKGWGIDLRYKLFEGAELPTVTLSTSYDTMTGNFSVNTPNINQSGTYTDGGTPYSATLTGASNYALSWNTQSLGAKVMVGKSLGILYPFAGIGFQRNSGSITSTITGNFNENTGSGSNPFSINAVSAGSPVVLEPKYVLGFTLGAGLGLGWSVVGESNGTDVAGTTSFALQF